MSLTEPDAGGWTPPSATERKALLDRTRSIAMVGVSANPSRPSNFVATYLMSSSASYELFFVNPTLDELFGQPCYPSLDALPAAPDMVDVFRRNDDLPEVAAEAIAVGAKSFWGQLGLHHDGAAAACHDAGLDVVMNRCLKIEHARFHGGLHLAGFDTGVIDSRRR